MKLIARIEGALFYRMDDDSIEVVSVGARWSLNHYVKFVLGLILTTISTLVGVIGLIALLFNFYVAVIALILSVVIFVVSNVLLSMGLIESGNIPKIQAWCLRNTDNPGAMLLYNSLQSYQDKEKKE